MYRNWRAFAPVSKARPSHGFLEDTGIAKFGNAREQKRKSTSFWNPLVLETRRNAVSGLLDRLRGVLLGGSRARCKNKCSWTSAQFLMQVSVHQEGVRCQLPDVKIPSQRHDPFLDVALRKLRILWPNFLSPKFLSGALLGVLCRACR